MDEWKKLRRQVQRERQKVRDTQGFSKDAKTVSAAQESAFTTVLWLMDRIEAKREP